MRDFKKILFPVDLSKVSEMIVPYVRNVASKYEAEIHLIFAVRVLDHFTSIYVPHPSISQFAKELMEGAEKKMDEFVAEHFKDFGDIKTAVVAGDAAEEIVKYIEEQHIDLLIMGTHGRKGMDKILFGSVAERVVKNSPVPVMVVNPYKAPG